MKMSVCFCGHCCREASGASWMHGASTRRLEVQMDVKTPPWFGTSRRSQHFFLVAMPVMHSSTLKICGATTGFNELGEKSGLSARNQAPDRGMQPFGIRSPGP